MTGLALVEVPTFSPKFPDLYRRLTHSKHSITEELLQLKLQRVNRR